MRRFPSIWQQYIAVVWNVDAQFHIFCSMRVNLATASRYAISKVSRINSLWLRATSLFGDDTSILPHNASLIMRLFCICLFIVLFFFLLPIAFNLSLFYFEIFYTISFYQLKQLPKSKNFHLPHHGNKLRGNSSNCPFHLCSSAADWGNHVDH